MEIGFLYMKVLSFLKKCLSCFCNFKFKLLWVLYLLNKGFVYYIVYMFLLQLKVYSLVNDENFKRVFNNVIYKKIWQYVFFGLEIYDII